MRYVLCLRLAHFYVRSLRDTSGKALVVIRDKKVLDSDQHSESKGVWMGMGERQARAILGDGIFHQWKEDEFRQAQIAWLDRCVPFTDGIEPSDQHEAFFDLGSHPNPHEIAKRIGKAVDQPAHLGAAQSKWLSALSAGVAPAGHLFDSAVHEPAEFLSRLPIGRLSPVPPEQRQRLAFLGYRTIGEVAALPISVLEGQFGKDSLTIHQAAIGRLSDPVTPLYPPGSLSVSLVLEGGVDSTETLDIALVSLAAKLGDKLASLERQSNELRLFTELESGRIIECKRKFNKALRCRLSALAALRLLIPRNLREPVVRIVALAPNLERCPRVQHSLEGKLMASRKDQAVEIALRSVRTVFGDRAVVEGKRVEQPRRVKVLKEWKESTGWR